MVLEARVCGCCGRTNLVKNGKNATSQQRYKCNEFGITRILDSLPKADQVDLAQVERSYQERNSFRSTARIFKVSHTTVQRWLKKAQKQTAFLTSGKHLTVYPHRLIGKQEKKLDKPLTWNDSTIRLDDAFLAF
jgi:transposase-like protein